MNPDYLRRKLARELTRRIAAMSPLEVEAALLPMPTCEACGQRRGDVCITPSGGQRIPHKVRRLAWIRRAA